MEMPAIHKALEECPDAIQKAAVKVSEAKAALDNAKRAAEKARAMAVINNQNAKNQTVLNALVENDSLVEQAEAEIIRCNAEYLIALSKHEKEKDTFDSAKKEANIIVVQMRSFPS